MNRGSKYYSLYNHLRQGKKEEVTLTFAQIEKLIGTALPESARQARAFWSNRSKGAPQASAWIEAGYEAAEVDLDSERVTFRKLVREYKVKRQGDTVLWDGELVKALRKHMNFNQAQLAEALGVRQQTVSEWETSVYAPSRAMSKYLTIVAERAGFTYGEKS